jgi:hypothetical protein
MIIPFGGLKNIKTMPNGHSAIIYNYWLVDCAKPIFVLIKHEIICKSIGIGIANTR